MESRQATLAYRNKTYIAFDGDEDIRYYWLMTAWKANDGCSMNFHDAHDLNTARDSSQEESIKKQLRERFANSKLFVILIGEKTKNLVKFVKWEMEVAIKLGLPLIGVNLNGSRRQDNRCPSTIKDELAIYVPFDHALIEYAMSHWPDRHEFLRKSGSAGPFYYKDEVYKKLGK